MTLTGPSDMGFREAAAPYLFDAVPEPLVVLTAHGVITGVNASAERMFGRPVHCLVGRRLSAFLRPGGGDSAGAPATLDFAVGAGGAPGTPAVFRHESGRDIHVEVRCAPVSTAAGPSTVVSIHDMTAERERAESSRAGSERLLRIAEATRVGVGLIRIDPPEYIYANPAFREMVGADEMVGTDEMQPAQVGAPTTGSTAVVNGRETLRRALVTIGSGQPFTTAEVPMAGANGDIRWVRMSTGQVSVANGATTELAVTLEDITALKDVETTLRDSQRVMLEMADTIEIGFLLQQVSDQRIVYVSPGFLRIFGFDPAGPTPDFLELRQLIHPDDREALADAVLLVESGGRVQRDLRITHPDGRQRWVRFTANPIVDADGVVSRLAVAAEVFTAVREAEMVVRSSEERFRRAANAIDVGISLRQLEPHRFLYVNSRYIELIGYDPTVADDATVQEAVDRLHPDDRDGVLVDYWKRTMSGMSAQAEMRVMLDSGGTRWVRATSHPIPAEPGSPAMAAGTIEDITDRKAAEQAAQSAREKAELAILTRSEFLSRISHDLRTPLNAVLGFEHLLDGDVAPGPESDAVGHILRGGRNLLNMINDLLDDPRIGDGLEVSAEIVDVGELLRETIASVTPIAVAGGVGITAELPEAAAVLVVVADRRRLRQVLNDLLSNAVQYNQRDGQVEVTCALQATEVMVSITDSGIGIRAEDIPRLFGESDRQAVPGSGMGATGIGLALAQRLVSVMGGRLDVTCTAGRGSVFTVRMPIAPSDSSGGALHLPVAHPKVLYIQDSASSADLVRRILRKRPAWSFHHCADGASGLELAATLDPQLIMMDIRIPDMSAVDLLRALRSRTRTEHIPVFVMTADAGRDDLTRLRVLGAQGFVSQPFDVSEILRILDANTP
ncbi:PAS domain-containing protein [Nakamurella sp. GG22]